MSTSSHAAAGPARSLDRAASSSPHSGAGRLLAAVARSYRLRRAARELHALDDRMLRDIGLDRGDVWLAVRAGRDLA